MPNLNTAITNAKRKARRLYNDTGKDARLFVILDTYTYSPYYYTMTDQDYYFTETVREDDVKALVFFGTGGYPEPPQFDIEYY